MTRIPSPHDQATVAMRESDVVPGGPAVPARSSRLLTRLLSSAEVPVLVAVPLLLGVCAYFQVDQAGLLTLIMTFVCVGLFFVNFERSSPGLRQVMPIVVLVALACAVRILFAPFPSVKPVSAICILAGVVFGRRSGFMVGALSALVSNFFFGQGPWTPWQMYAWGLVGYVAGVLSTHGAFEHRGVLSVYGFVSALGYGFILNSWYVVAYVHPITVPAALLAYGAGIVFDIMHGTATVVFLAAIYLPWKVKLERIQRKYALCDAKT